MSDWLDPGLKTKAVTDILGTTEKIKTEGWYLILVFLGLLVVLCVVI